MSCNNCYNGCSETTSDKCVKYTGADVETLNLYNGDNLYTVLQELISKTLSFLDASGINVTIDAEYCELVTNYLPSCKPICSPPTAQELFSALVAAACNLQGQVTTLDTAITTLNADYNVSCLSGVTNSSDTHAVVQAIINYLCTLGSSYTAFTANVAANYVKVEDFDSLVAAYLASVPASTQQYTKMVPYTVVEYYGSLSYFDVTGKGIAGLGWDKVYLCNGNNGTPDKRGRVAVGAIVDVGGGTLSSAVDPVYSGNPNYALGDTTGANTVTLDATQIPAHTHSASVTDTGHTHLVAASTTTSTTPLDATHAVSYAGSIGTNPAYELVNATSVANLGLSSTNSTLGVSVSNSSTGGGLGHSNIQPTIACYYIMYIP